MGFDGQVGPLQLSKVGGASKTCLSESGFEGGLWHRQAERQGVVGECIWVGQKVVQVGVHINEAA